MKKLILIVVLVLFSISFTKDYGDYIVITNNSYRAQSVTIYYDYGDGYWTAIERMHLPSRYTTTFTADTSMLYKYAYRSSSMAGIKQVYSKHIQLY